MPYTVLARCTMSHFAHRHLFDAIFLKRVTSAGWSRDGEGKQQPLRFNSGSAWRVMQYGARPGLSEAAIAYVLGCVLRALVYLHDRGVVHKYAGPELRGPFASSRHGGFLGMRGASCDWASMGI
jgi:hypothetical protein